MANRTALLALALICLSRAVSAGGFAKAYVPKATQAQIQAVSAAYQAQTGPRGDGRGVLLLASQLTPTYQKLLVEAVKVGDQKQISVIMDQLSVRARGYAELQVGRLVADVASGRLTAAEAFPPEIADVYGPHLPLSTVKGLFGGAENARVVEFIDRNVQALGFSGAGVEEALGKSDEAFRKAVADEYKKLSGRDFWGRADVEALHARIVKVMADGRRTDASKVASYKGSMREGLSWTSVRDVNDESRQELLARLGDKTDRQTALERALNSADDAVFQTAVEDAYAALIKELETTDVPMAFASSWLKERADGLHATIAGLMKEAGRPKAATRVVYKGSARESLSWTAETDLNDAGRKAALAALAKSRASFAALQRARRGADEVLRRYRGPLAAALVEGRDDKFDARLDEAYAALAEELGIAQASDWDAIRTAREQIAAFHDAVAGLAASYDRPKAGVITVDKGSGRELVVSDVVRDMNDFARDALLSSLAGRLPVERRIPQWSFDALKAKGAMGRAMPWHLTRVARFYEKVLSGAPALSPKERRELLEQLESGFGGRIQPIREVKSFVWSHDASGWRVFKLGEFLWGVEAWGLLGGAAGVLLTVIPVLMGAISPAWLVAAVSVVGLAFLAEPLAKAVERFYGWLITHPWTHFYDKLRDSVASK